MNIKAPHPALKHSGAFGLELPPIPKEIFLSYARRDERLAMAVERRLEAFGFTVFRDRNELDAGVNYPERLRAAISEAKAVVCILTPWAATRPWVLLECTLAQETGKLVACSAGGLNPDKLPPPLQDLHLPDVSRASSDDDLGLVEVARTLARRIGRPAVAARTDFQLRQFRDPSAAKRGLFAMHTLKREWKAVRRKPINPLAVEDFYNKQARGTTLEPEVARWIATTGEELLKLAKGELADIIKGQGDPQAAVTYALTTATMGYGPALAFAGLAFYNGWFGQAMTADARKLWEAGAIRGNVDCYKYFGSALKSGSGGPVDTVAAADWFRLAAGAGDAFCMTEYANLVSKSLDSRDRNAFDFQYMKYWYTKAALAGNTVGKINLASLLASNKSATIEEVDRALALLTDVTNKYTGEESDEAWQGVSMLKSLLARDRGSSDVRARAAMALARHA